MIISLLLLTMQTPGSVTLVEGSREPVAVRGTDIERAMAEFAAICLAKPFDRAAFNRAVGASSWKYERQAPGITFQDNWQSPYAYATFTSDGAFPRGLAVPQCNLLAASRTKVGGDAMKVAIDGLLKSAGVSEIEFTRADGLLIWTWKNGTGLAQLHLLDPDPEGRVMNLSLQFWTPDWLARAPELLKRMKRREQPSAPSEEKKQ